MRKTLGTMLAISLALAGCARPPASLRGDFYAPITPDEAAVENRTGAYVRWGGQILSSQHEKEHTCFEVLGLPLDERARPEQTDAALGRFRACASGFYDPAVYTDGRSITVVGLLGPDDSQTIGSYDLRMPVVQADVVYLWPIRVYYAAGPPYPYGYGWGWGGPWGWGWAGYPYGWGWGPGWGWGGWGPYYGPWYGSGWVSPYRGGYPRGGHPGGPPPGGGGRPIPGGGPPSGGPPGGGGARVPVRGR